MFDDGYVDDGYVDEVVGMDMMNDGMMQYEQGVILTQMGMPGLGMAQMQMGQMQMAQGQTLMEVGMIENGMGMGYGTGYGMGYGYNGIVAAQQALLMAETACVCMGVGCTRPCCVRRCAPGCMLPCCQKQVIMVNNNQKYMQPNLNFQQINKQPVQQAQPIFAGPLYHQQLFVWHYTQNVMVTLTHFGNEHLSGITKLKIKREAVHNDCVFLKTTTFNSNDHYFAVPRHQQINWFCAIIWAKMQLQRYNCGLYQQFNGFIEGRILRKSRFLGEWAFRQVIIDFEGLKSYVNRNQLPTTRILRIPELWTRFQVIQGQMYLVIKLHFEGSKYEYGIPLNNAIIWLRAFGSLMR